MAGEGNNGARVWDLPTRAFHWLLLVAVATSWFTGEFEIDDFEIHIYSGYCICGLLIFRLCWGLMGSGPSRFSSFVTGPAAVMRYAASLRSRRPSRWPGHNPMGGWSVVALLSVLLATVAAGMFSDDETFYQGPLASLVSPDLRAEATNLHHILTSAVMLLVFLHLVAVTYYAAWRRENLVVPMVTGSNRHLAQDALPAPELSRLAVLVRFIIAVAISAALTAAIVNADDWVGRWFGG